jgi:uncharacterized protein (TIGR02246 family)
MQLPGSLALTLALCLTAGQGRAAKDKDNPKDADALFERAKAFVEAFHKGDAKAVAAFWTADGDYTDQNGKRLKGRDEIEKAFEGFFAENKGAKLRIDSESMRFVSPDVAVEDGVTEVFTANGAPPSRARYTIVHVKKEGQWFLSSVRDAAYSPPTTYERLRGLEWLVGDWTEEADKGEVARLSFSWSQNQNFMVSSFSTTFKNIVMGGGTQWIGWDPLAKKVRSWSFESSGGFGEGSWSSNGNSWTIKTTAILPDGKKASATNVITRIDDHTLALSSKERMLDGKEMPDIKEVKLKRQK